MSFLGRHYWCLVWIVDKLDVTVLTFVEWLDMIDLCKSANAFQQFSAQIWKPHPSLFWGNKKTHNACFYTSQLEF